MPFIAFDFSGLLSVLSCFAVCCCYCVRFRRPRRRGLETKLNKKRDPCRRTVHPPRLLSMSLPSATMALSHAWIIVIAALQYVCAAFFIETALLVSGAAALGGWWRADVTTSRTVATRPSPGSIRSWCRRGRGGSCCACGDCGRKEREWRSVPRVFFSLFRFFSSLWATTVVVVQSEKKRKGKKHTTRTQSLGTLHCHHFTTSTGAGAWWQQYAVTLPKKNS